jgi:hypothetical protein
VQIDINYDSSVANAPSSFETDVNIAVQYLESLFTNPITITIDVGYGEIDGQPLENGALGESEANYIGEDYSQVRSALIAQNAPGSSTLPTTSPLNGVVEIPTAEAMALGLLASSSPNGYVGFSSSFPFSYGNGTTPPSNEYYFIGVVEHEITEDMGRVSLINEQPDDYSVMDLYRWSSPGVRDTTTGGNGSTAYFSINDGTTNLGTWNNQVSNGDLGDWYPSGPAPGGNDAFNDFSNPGVINVVSQSDITLMEALGYTSASADMILVDSSGDYQIDDLGNNTILSSSSLTQIGSPWQAVGLGDFSGTDTSDMLLRNPSTGAFQVDDIANNAVTQTATLGNVGSNWSVVGFGNFDNSGFTDMMMYDSSDGAYDIFDIRSNQIVGANQIAAVGSNWQVAGFGDFNGDGTTDMLLRDPSSGAFEYYDIVNGQLASTGTLGNVGANWQVVGFGNFDNSGFSDMMMYDSADGAYDIFDIRNNEIVGAQQIATIGANWQVAGFADVNGDGTMDMVTYNPSSGAFEYYDIANGQLAADGTLGQGGTQLTVVGLAPYSASTTSASTTTTAASNLSAASGIPGGSVDPVIADGSPSQQPMGLGGGASEVVPPMSSLFSAPATMAQLSPAVSEFGSAPPLLAVNPLQHAV